MYLNVGVGGGSREFLAQLVQPVVFFSTKGRIPDGSLIKALLQMLSPLTGTCTLTRIHSRTAANFHIDRHIVNDHSEHHLHAYPPVGCFIPWVIAPSSVLVYMSSILFREIILGGGHACLRTLISALKFAP